jgi:hypothetical protein
LILGLIEPGAAIGPAEAFGIIALMMRLRICIERR